MDLQNIKKSVSANKLKISLTIVSFLIVSALLLFSEFFGIGLSFVLGHGAEIESSSYENESINESKHWVNESYAIDHLSRTEAYITQRNGTEPAFANDYYDNEREGIYVDVVSGEPLFSSEEKFKSGTGWPHFYEPLEPANIQYYEDEGALGVRTGLRSRHAGSHLGHVFEDSIAQSRTPTGRRYCINSAALDFVPLEDLESEGYGEYINHFQNNQTGS